MSSCNRGVEEEACNGDSLKLVSVSLANSILVVMAGLLCRLLARSAVCLHGLVTGWVATSSLEDDSSELSLLLCFCVCTGARVCFGAGKGELPCWDTAFREQEFAPPCAFAVHTLMQTAA